VRQRLTSYNPLNSWQRCSAGIGVGKAIGTRRYRYYACRTASQDRRNNRPVRVPAADIEAPVLSGFRRLLENPQRVMDLLRKPDDSAESTKTLLTAAQDTGSRLIEGPHAEISNFIRRVVNRVIIHPDKARVLFLRDALRSFLLEDNHGSGDVRKAVPVQRDSESIASFEFAALLRRSGREVRLILSSDSEKLTSSRRSSSLLKAVARSYEWCQQILRGEACGPASIAEKSGLSERYVRHIFRHAFLAPDIVQAIVDGSQPPHLSLIKLNTNLPASWVEQRKLLGFSAPRLIKKFP
jgi:site-specific DNA recombinase